MDVVMVMVMDVDVVVVVVVDMEVVLVVVMVVVVVVVVVIVIASHFLYVPCTCDTPITSTGNWNVPTIRLGPPPLVVAPELSVLAELLVPPDNITNTFLSKIGQGLATNHGSQF